VRLKPPRHDFASGVRAVETITTSVISVSWSEGAHRRPSR
jgi:hypothetical protein